MYHANTSFTGNINIQKKAQNLHILYMTYWTFRADLLGHVSMWYEINYKYLLLNLCEVISYDIQ